MRKKIKFTETALLEASEAILSGLIPIEKLEPILQDMDSAGYYSVCCWGRSTFETCLRFLNENPWGRLRILRENLPNTKLQMTLAGQCLLSDRQQHDSVVKRFINLAIDNGIDIFSIFDPLNSIDNMSVAIKAALDRGASVCGTLLYVNYPDTNAERYVELGIKLAEIGVNTICIKDLTGELSALKTYELVASLKSALDIPLVFHSSCNTGMATMSYLKAVEAGIDIIETATAPLSGGISLPATETFAYALKDLGYELDINEKSIDNISIQFKKIRDETIRYGKFDATVLETEPDSFDNHIPNTFLSVFHKQLSVLHCEDRCEEILREILTIQREMGFPALTYPIDRIIATQATQNVLKGTRYHNVGSDMVLFARGAYGIPLVPLDSKIQEIIMKGEKRFKTRYADTLPENSFDENSKRMKNLLMSDEDIVSYLLFPDRVKEIIATATKQTDKLYKAFFTVERIQ